MGIDAFRYDGKRALVIGGATGMGAATAQTVGELGAEVVVLDVADVSYPAAQVVQLDLRNRDEVDQALAQIDGPIHAVFEFMFSCIISTHNVPTTTMATPAPAKSTPL